MEENPLAQLLRLFQIVGILKIPWVLECHDGIYEAKVNLTPLGVAQVVSGRDRSKQGAKKVASTKALALLGSPEAKSKDPSKHSFQWILPFVEKGKRGSNPKSCVLEAYQKVGKKLPEYESTRGLSERWFVTVNVSDLVDNLCTIEGQGNGLTKAEAERQASEMVLNQLERILSAGDGVLAEQEREAEPIAEEKEREKVREKTEERVKVRENTEEKEEKEEKEKEKEKEKVRKEAERVKTPTQVAAGYKDLGSPTRAIKETPKKRENKLQSKRQKDIKEMREEAKQMGGKIPFALLRCIKEKRLGGGATGEVYQGRWLRSNEEPDDEGRAVALKEITQSETKELEEIMKIAAMPLHTNVVEVFGMAQSKKVSYVVSELVDGENLQNLLEDGQCYHRSLMLQILQKVAAGMEHLHRHEILHRDLAARNILIADEGETVKICDFGLSRKVDENGEYAMVSPIKLPYRHMAPESLQDGIHSFESDVWMFGCLCWELWTCSQPHAECRKVQDLIEREKLALCFDGIYGMPWWLKDLLNRCHKKEPGERPSFKEIAAEFKAYQIY